MGEKHLTSVLLPHHCIKSLCMLYQTALNLSLPLIKLLPYSKLSVLSDYRLIYRGVQVYIGAVLQNPE
jgi:hypothetical protein